MEEGSILGHQEAAGRVHMILASSLAMLPFVSSGLGFTYTRFCLPQLMVPNPTGILLDIDQVSWIGMIKDNTHLSPGFSFIYDLAYDSGILQSELFTNRNQNLDLAKLPNSGFWRYGQIFK